MRLPVLEHLPAPAELVHDADRGWNPVSVKDRKNAGAGKNQGQQIFDRGECVLTIAVHKASAENGGKALKNPYPHWPNLARYAPSLALLISLLTSSNSTCSK